MHVNGGMYILNTTWSAHHVSRRKNSIEKDLRRKMLLIDFPGEKSVTTKTASEWRETPMNGPQDVFWPGWSESKLQPERWPGADGLPGGQKALSDRLCGAVRGAGLHHDFWLPQQLHRPPALLQIQEAADTGEHAVVEHKCQRHVGVHVRHHTQLRLQHSWQVDAGTQRLQLVRLRQLLLW